MLGTACHVKAKKSQKKAKKIQKTASSAASAAYLASLVCFKVLINKAKNKSKGVNTYVTNSETDFGESEKTRT
jgi:hypothetical protein